MKLTLSFILIIFLSYNYITADSFFEDFNNNENDWSISKDSNRTTDIINGAYNIEHHRDKGTWFFWKDFDVYYEKDYSIEAKITLTDGVDSWGYGIIWGTLDANNLYSFNISGNGQYYLYKYHKGKYEPIKKWERNQNVLLKNSPNILKVEQKNKHWYFYINNSMVFDTIGMQGFGKNIGFVVTNKMTIAIDYLKIEYDTAKINLIENVDSNIQRENMGENINSEYEDILPLISQDGKKLYYVRKKHPENIGPDNRDDIWYSEIDKNGIWKKSQQLGFPLNNDGFNSVISVSPDGNSIVLMNTYSDDGKTLVGGGISMSKKTKEGWAIPKKVIIEDYYNNHEKNFAEYCLSSDKNVLLMTVQRFDTYGTKDIYISFRKNSGFSVPKNLGHIVNTHQNEISPFLAPDNVTLYFSSYGHPGYGSADVFVTRRLDSTWLNWSQPQNLGLGLNSPNWDAYYTIPASGDYAYFVSTDNSFGQGDIFRMKLPESAKPNPVILVYGKVINTKDKQPLEASIVYNNLDNNVSAGSANSDPNTGEYKIILPYGKSYSFLAQKEGFYSISDNLDAKKITKYQEIERNLYLTPIEVGEKIRLNNIFFDFDKDELRAESYPELQRLIKILNDYPKMKVEIGGHTDSRGDKKYNIHLSRDRANAVKEYLENQEISSNRLTAKGYGEDNPLATNKTDEGRKRNRRVEFKILTK